MNEVDILMENTKCWVEHCLPAYGKNSGFSKVTTIIGQVQNGVTELVIATNATLEGQTTAYFVTEYFRNNNLKISRFANGILLGGELDYLDEGTLSLAIALRQPFD